MKLIPVKEALDIILKHTVDFGVEYVNFDQSLGRIIKENIYSDRDFPPFDRVSMDGIAIRKADFDSGQRSFTIEGTQAAGSPPMELLKENGCLEIMTGAVLPVNTDAVIPYEMVTIQNGVASVNTAVVKANQNIHSQGIDKRKGELLISENKVISTAELGVLATVGKAKVSVAKLPKVMIISTGNELVDVHEKPEDHQIRRSNVFTLQGLLTQKGIQSETAHLPDERAVLVHKIGKFLDDYDVLIFSGAVSKGKFDFLPEVLDELGVKKHFHKVAQRPGKPFWFGQKGHKSVFAFPGNPVSTFVCCLNYFFPWYWKSTGIETDQYQEAILDCDYEFSKPLTYFLQVKLATTHGVVYATPETGNGSGDLANLINADAFLELPQDRSTFTKGESFRVIPFRNF